MHFLHTADWQIGMRALHAGKAAATIRESRLRTAERVCEMARQEAVDFVLLAGDTFEDNSIDRQLIVRVVQILSEAGLPFFVLPGNHDPYQPGSVWEHPAWKDARNITIMGERTPLSIPGGTLWPCPIFERRSVEDPTAWIPTAGNAGIRVIAAHGNTTQFVVQDPTFPISIDTPARTGADYVALGHWHSLLELTSGGNTRMAYSGTHETTRFGEADSGNVLLVRIDAPGSPPEITLRKVGELNWQRVGCGENITAPGKLAEIAARVSAIQYPDKTLMEVELSGLLFESDRGDLERLKEACARFLSCRIKIDKLKPAPQDDRWVQMLPAGAVRAAAAKLQAIAETNPQQAEVSTQALLQLFSFAGEVRL